MIESAFRLMSIVSRGLTPSIFFTVSFVLLAAFVLPTDGMMKGPSEVRETTQAFNRMKDRLSRS